MSDAKVRVDAKNRDFIRFEQVEKEQEYRLAEADQAEQFDEEFRIRTCDLGRFLRGNEEDRRLFARDLGEALREIGFAILEGHGVDPRLYDEAEERTVDVFTRPSLEEKLRYRARRHGSVNQGYFPIKETSDIHPDLVEGWVFCRRAFDLDPDPPRRYDWKDYWPIPEAEPLFRRLCSEHERLVLPIMQSILRVSRIRSPPLRSAAHGHEFRSPSELLPARRRARTTPPEPRACWGTRTSICSPSFRRRASRVSRS